ncbi:MAG: 4Fe-4S binding protein [Anaerolineae bacterium]|nr:4Fe-4S binding protein [Anaerolineae bacterium]
MKAQRRRRLRQIAQRWIRLRQLVQYLALALFLYLFVSTAREGRSPIPVNLFSCLDPLLALSSMLATRRVILAFAPALVLTLATLALGRFWCGWLCPLGTILDLFGPPKRDLPQQLRQAKHFLLFILLFAALFANLTLIFLDPITVFLRALAGVIYPGIKSVLEEGSQFSIQPILILPLVVILALNLIARRFWCRYLCPLGALLGLVSKIAWIKRRVSEECVSCGLCPPVCPMGTIDEEDHTSDPGECIQCMNCLAPCPVEAIKFGREPGLNWGYEYDPSRRQLLASLAAGAGGALLLRTGLFKKRSPHLLRPPGARPEAEFLAKCVRCGQCIQVCPNSALQPTLLEAGWEGIWTPMLVPRLGFCDYSCNACGQVCPTGAIPPLSLEEKRTKVIGTARVDEDRCISCMICRDMCPVGAIEMVEVEKEGVMVMLPQVMPVLCTGCGTCEYICPVEGEAAIRVYVPGVLSSLT